ncbi:SET domain-containing protein [Trema orientale]|uniref:SET domain-containing protein n=1 Tax=Trema orientale TaxID=63057 RepID=A0A2P5FT27_TREOI|nr:SET domain-containing protein [Trema orientale]
MANPEEEEAKLECFLQWLKVNGVELRGCKIKRCDSNKGFGIFLANDVSDEVLLVVPLDLAITPMRVLQDPLIGSECRGMFEEGEVDDRFLMILLLTVERLRKNSSWKPYLDMLPTGFGNPLWFSDDELLELKGTTLYRATELQKKTLLSLYENKVKCLVKKLLTLDGGSDREVCFEDFLWANSIFWARALNIPLLHSYVFPQTQGTKDISSLTEKSSEVSPNNSRGEFVKEMDEKRWEVRGFHGQVNEETCPSTEGETLWVEGLVPGIDFCNHDLKAAATWEVDGTGSTTGLPFSMYLLSAGQSSSHVNKEITISYGNKGNEELLYLYGFVVENNPDDYLMVHYPVEAIQSIPFSDSKVQLLEAQNVEMRCLLPRGLLDHGFFQVGIRKIDDDGYKRESVCSYSWSGQRKMPSYLDKLLFPENFLSALRTIAMQEDELFKVSTLLEELVGSGGERQPTDTEVRAAVWEACGDSGALQLLIDLLNTK